MQKRAVNGPTLASLRKLNHHFGGTYFPYFTNEFSTQQFSIFVNTSHRPLVYRKGLLMMSQMENQLLREQFDTPLSGQIERHSFAWGPDNIESVEILPCYHRSEKFIAVSSDILLKKPSFADAVCVKCVFSVENNMQNYRPKSLKHIENHMVFEIDESVRNISKKISDDNESCLEEYTTEVLLYPYDLIFLPSLWKASIKPLFGASKIGKLPATHRSTVSSEGSCFSMIHRQSVLQCSFTAYKNSLKRTGHFSVAENLTFHGKTDEEFLRKSIRKQSRWDEINEGNRKVF